MFRRDATLTNMSLRVSAICTGSVITPFSIPFPVQPFYSPAFASRLMFWEAAPDTFTAPSLLSVFPCCCRLIQKYYFRNECQARVPGFHQVSKREKTFAAQWFYCFRAFGNLMKPEARVFEETIQNYAVLSFSHFSLKWLVCVICCIQSAFIVFVSFCFYKLSNSGFRVAPPNLYSKSVMNLTADLKWFTYCFCHGRRKVSLSVNNRGRRTLA